MANNKVVEQVKEAVKEEALEWQKRARYATNAEMSAWIEGATSALAVIDRTYVLSNAVLEMLEELFSA